MAVCNERPWWDDRTKQLYSVMRDHMHEKKCADIFFTPRSIYEYFDSQVYGCSEYKKAISTAIWTSLQMKTKANFLVVGPSGCGKTELARVFSKIYYNTIIFDASTVAPVSYKGNATITQCLLEVDTSELALPPWIFIDEIDKAILKNSELAPMILNELLKMIEGGTIRVGTDEKNSRLVDTSRINFVFLGTFANLKKEQKKSFGFVSGPDGQTENSNMITRENLHKSTSLSNEFLGRINGGIIEVEPMNEERALKILSDPRYSPISRLEQMYHIRIKVTDKKLRELAGMTSRFGVRGIYSEIQSLINNAIFEDCTLKSITL